MSEQESGGSSGIGGGIAIFLALIAVGVATYPAYELYRQSGSESAATERLDQLERDLQMRSARLDELSAQLDAEPEFDQSQFDEQLAGMRAEIDADLEAIRGRLTTSSEDWLFAEVEYLVRMANQRVLMERDAASALQLLSGADRIIKDSEGLTAHALRSALANDIAALKAVDTPDTQGVYLELSAQIGQVPNLKRDLPSFEVELPPVEELPETASMMDRAGQLAGQAGARLTSLVDFRRRDTEVKPILPPDQAYYLRQNLILKLQIAQMALLEGEGEVYEVSLSEAHDWLISSFDDDAGRQAMAETLQKLSAINIEVELPDISASLNAARDMLVDFNEELVE